MKIIRSVYGNVAGGDRILIMCMQARMATDDVIQKSIADMSRERERQAEKKPL